MAQRWKKYAYRFFTALLVLLILAGGGVAQGAGLPQDAGNIPGASNYEGEMAQPPAESEAPLAELHVDGNTAEPEEPEQEEVAEDLDNDAKEDPAQPDGMQEESAEGLLPMAAAYTVLEDNASAVVTDFAQLKEAIEKDNGIINVYLGADITLESNRTEIPASKAEFKLSGRDPRTGTQYTVTEVNSTALANIVVPNSNGNATRKVTMEDITIINRGDYYGLIGVEDSNKGVEMVARNVVFNGRQFAYNLYGHLIFEGDNTVNILTVNGGGAQELAEVQNITVRGALHVDFQSTYPVFRMDLGLSNLVVEGTLDITAPRISTGNGIIRSAAGSNAVTIDIRPGATARITSNVRLVYEAANSMYVGAGAAFYYEWTGSLYAGIRLRKELVVGKDAVFDYRHTASGGYMFRFDGGTAEYSGGLMVFDSPKQVTLVNEANTAMVYGAANGRFQVVTQYMDYWQRNQSPDGPPTYSFNQDGTPDGGDIQVGLTHTAGNPTALDTNHSGITKDMLKLDATVRQLVFGKWTQSVLRFEGRCEQSGDILAEFSMEEQTVETGAEVHITPQEISGYVVTGYAIDGGGIQPLQGNNITVFAEKKEMLVTVYYSEPVMEITVPAKMVFAAYESNGGNIDSAMYSFENKSPFDVSVSLVSVEEQGGMKKEKVKVRDDLWLYLEPENKDRYNRVDIVSADGSGSYIGELAGRGGSMSFTLDGAYYGTFSKEALWPVYNLAFTFGISRKGEGI